MIAPAPLNADDGATALDRRLMASAIVLARRGLGRTAPNPAVGAVLYRPDLGEIVGRGWTQPGGRPHAEPEAIARAGEKARGATLYVTLEPCAHQGRTPPCADAIIAAGITRVVYGITDPDPRVSRRGLRRLDAAGIEVVRSSLVEAAHAVTLGHVLRVSERRPFVQLKIAVDASGDVPAGRDGAPVWATGPEARARGHMMRAMTDAILVGRGTAVADNPSLDCRLPGLAAQSPTRVILSGTGNVATDLRLFASNDREKPIVFIGRHAGSGAAPRLREAGADVQIINDVAGELWVPAILEALVERGITRLLVEGGPSVWHAFDRAGTIDELTLFRGNAGRETTFDLAAANQVRARYVSHSPLQFAGRMRVGDDDMVIWQRHRGSQMIEGTSNSQSQSPITEDREQKET